MLATFPTRGRLCRGYCFSAHACIHSDDMGIAVDRVLSYNGALETISLSFIPLPPSNLRPFGAPPSIGRRECPREPLPLEGAAERNEAGLASFGGGARVLSLTTHLRRSSRSFSYRFPHPISAPSGHLLPKEGGSVHASPFPWKGLANAARRGWLPFGAALGCFRKRRT